MFIYKTLLLMCNEQKLFFGSGTETEIPESYNDFHHTFLTRNHIINLIIINTFRGIYCFSFIRY